MIPKTGSLTGTTTTLTGEITTTYPGFRALPIPGVLFGPGVRFVLGPATRFDIETLAVSLGDSSREDIDESISNDGYSPNAKAKFAVRVGFRFSIGL